MEKFGEKEEGRWVSEKAHLYGCIIRYPRDKEAVKQYKYKPWRSTMFQSGFNEA
ncbi:D-alanyl-D-alanine carboxypeptidase family protein [Paenibacillus sp. IHBB 10380]|uniref:D-alanyl-D-alanine carboxypeptidase family protein n=1 Tax=Paenibacillus sp. IHBB 10380 TaxID=1566358 RepID=UPI0009E3557A|nr:D-alanyl-D-alanine carboxypeptidase family protein [Paenibacillus sp. IHBB 10380]